MLDNIAIAPVSTYKYMRIHLEPDLSWHHHIMHTFTFANHSFDFLKRNLICLFIYLLTYLHSPKGIAVEGCYTE